MDNDPDSQFLRRISLIEADLENLGSIPLEDFSRQWTPFVDDLKAALDAESLSVSTIVIAHTLANRVSHMVQTFLDLEVLADKLTSSLLEETTTIVDAPATASEPSDPTAVPQYIKPSYNWLLANLHNPYPSTRVRDSIAQRSGAARKDVDNWFIDARKRIGWNALRKASFSNKRVEIVDAATRFFVADDPKRPVDPSIEYEFIAIKKCAKDLYVDKFSESDLAVKLDMAVKNLTPQTKAEAKAEQLRQWQLQKDRESYPSPDRSPEPTRLSPVPYDDDDDTNAPQSISVSSRKRRSLSADPDSNQELEPSIDRPAKRSRLDIPSTSPTGLAFPTSLPSPAASVDEPLQVPEASIPPLPQSTFSAPPNRKRRLSDSDAQGAPKRPRNLPVGPRLQAVSDPLPLSSALFDVSAFDGWFQQHFDLQNAPNVGEISPCGFDVELGNISDFDCEAQTESDSGSPQTARQGSELPTIEVNLAELQAPDSELPSEFSFDDLQSLLSSDSITNFSQHVAPQTQDFSIPQIPSLGLDYLNDFGGSFYIPNEPTPAVNDSLSAPASTPAFDFQWEFSDYLNIGLQGHASPPGKGLDVLQNGLGFVPSLSMPSSTEFLVPSGSDYLASLQAQAARKEKEMKLKQMKEEALRLELELAASA